MLVRRRLASALVRWMAWALPMSLLLSGRAGALGAATPIQHVIIIMQENRSFDSYFGTFPGADGIDRSVCMPINPQYPTPCVHPFHDARDVNSGSTHDDNASAMDLDDGITTAKMDGFVAVQQHIANGPLCTTLHAHACPIAKLGFAIHDVMGFHTADEIPNYWVYAHHFVLQDRLFEGVRSYSWPSHLELASEWVAVCTNPTNAQSCTTGRWPLLPPNTAVLPWVSLFQLLDVHKVSWKWYLGDGNEPDCEDDVILCEPSPLGGGGLGEWNPAPGFLWVKNQGRDYLREHNPQVEQFYLDIQNGTLPQVAWVVPSDFYSEHAPSGVTRGMVYVTSLVNAVMNSPYWANTAIFISWDDFGGFYDHVVPPNVDRHSGINPIEGYGLRVPGLMISAYAKTGMIDHSLLSFDSYATLFEDLFMGGARLDPNALGNPDNRPTIRDALTSVTFLDGHSEPVGNLMNEFDFTQPPRPPVILSTAIPTDPVALCTADGSQPCTDTTVTITWNALDANLGYTYHVDRNGQDLPQCTGTAIYCTDTPGPGQYYYRVYSVSPQGVASPRSAAAEAIMP